MTEQRKGVQIGDERWPGWVAAAILTGYLCVNCARGLMFFDTGELAQTAMEFGVSHPPGQAFYIMVAGLWAHLFAFIGDPLWGLNLFSAITLGLCAVPLDYMIRLFVKAVPWIRCVLLVTWGLIPPAFDQGTRIEVYAPALLSMLWTVAIAMRWLSIRDKDSNLSTEKSDLADDQRPLKRWLLTWLALGAGVGITAGFNAIFGLLAAIGIAVGAQGALWRRSGWISKARDVSVAVAGAALGALFFVGLGFLFLKMRSDDPDAFVWGNWDSWSGFWRFVTGGDYQHTRNASSSLAAESGRLAVWSEHALIWIEWVMRQGGGMTLIAGLLGLASIKQLRLYAGPMATLAAVFAFENPIFYPEIPDYNGYLTVAIALSSVGLVAAVNGLYGLCKRACASNKRPMVLAQIVTWGAMLAIGIDLCLGDRPPQDRSRASVDGAERLASLYADGLSEGSLLLVESDHLVFALGYLHRVERRWPTIKVINEGFGGSSWYWRYLQKIYALPQIELRAPNTATRLKRLIEAMPGQRVFVESAKLAVELGMKACPRPFGFEAVPTFQPCDFALEGRSQYEAEMRSLWSSTTGHDVVGHHVLALEALQKAKGYWLAGDVTQTLWALKSGISTSEDLPLVSLPRLDRPSPFPQCDALLGDSTCNRMIGHVILQRAGYPKEASAWFNFD